MENACGDKKASKVDCLECMLAASPRLVNNSNPCASGNSKCTKQTCTGSDLLRFCEGYPLSDARTLVLYQGINFCSPNVPLPGCGAYGQWGHWKFDLDQPGFQNCGSCREKGQQYEMTQCSQDG